MTTTSALASAAPHPARSVNDETPVNDETSAGAPVGVDTTASGVAEDDVVDLWGHGSFPASDPPANW